MSFGAKLKKFSKNASQGAEEVRRASLLKLFGSIIDDTPVLDGFLRGAWQTNIGNPKLSDIARTSEAATKNEVAENLGSMKDTVYFTNNKPYAYRIEFDGWSKIKAPEGMVRKNIIRFSRLVKEQARGRK